ncbi:hypothetical protein [Pontibacter ramchanderi]|uniref:Uncharacterized protein n=1 Tax=Pontibacter ramchanderi TaxID=1179743 RepID=A0A2N3V0D1_9BACT|nr:hypothetical protein [Pontibacter ramchanderi]PKV75079.1 hypothetical protein BD749_0016 [Pontibacter ramchanderi]
MKTYFLLLLLGFSSFFSAASAQTGGEIIVQKKGLGFAYYQQGSQISKKQLLHVLEQHPEARKELQKGYRNALPAAALSYVGALLISYPLSKQLAGNQPNWLVSGAGAGLLTFSVPFAGARMKREHLAIHAYNEGQYLAKRPETDLRIGYAYNRASFVFTF